MFYENENENDKDILQDSSDIQISEDGVVSWGDVLDDTSDISLEDNNKVESDDNSFSLDESDDEIQLVPSEDEPDEEELRRILSEGDTSVTETEGTEEAPDIPAEEEASENEFEFDDNLLNDTTGATEDIPLEEITPRKPLAKEKSQSSLMPVLIALLVAILAVGGGYGIYTYMQENEVSSGDLKMNSPVKEVTQEDLEQRTNEQEDIPVVNEETEDALTAQDPVPEEKKEVIDIKVEGRQNPFLPKSKYLSVEIPETYVNFENPSIPKPPASYAPVDNKAIKMLSIAVSGIMYDDVKPSAIITYDNNDYFVQRGDKLNEYRVIDIGKNYVLVAFGRNTYKANVGEEFKITDNFYGNAKYLPTGRQYQTVKSDNGGGNSSGNEGVVEINVE